MKEENFFSLKIILPILILVAFFLIFGYFFRLNRSNTNSEEQQEQTVSYSESPVESSQISKDTVIIKKDESESIIGSPTPRIAQPEIPSEEIQSPQKRELFSVMLGTLMLHLERADSEYVQTHGLTGRASLPKDEGMLYIVTKHQEFSYWAKDMRFATDVIWIDQDFHIVDISKNITPDSYPDSVFKAKEPARYVIEVNAGVADTAGVRIGDTVNIASAITGS